MLMFWGTASRLCLDLLNEELKAQMMAWYLY